MTTGSTSREAALDEVLLEAIEALHEGRSVDVDELVRGREELRSEIGELLAVARDVAQRRVTPPPEVTGYTILGELGRGAMGAVYLALHAALDREVALKVLPAIGALAQRERERFLGEARALARLRHESVVSVHDVIEAEGLCAFAMDRVEGPTLARVIDELGARGGAPELSTLRDAFELEPRAEHHVSWVCGLGVQLGRALDHAHDEGLLHRDVKPSNVLLRRDATALLADFGLVRDDAHPMGTRTGVFLGTAAYAAPEQLRGESRAVGRRSDVYGLGATLYHALTRRVPHRGSSPMEIEREIARAVTPSFRDLPIEVPRDLEAILHRCLEPQPERRYGTAGEVADDLDRLLALRPVLARPIGPLRRLHRALRRHRGAAVVSMAIALLVLLATIALGQAERWRAEREAEVGELRREAWVELLDPELGERIFIALELGRADDRSDESIADDDAIALYDRILAIDHDQLEARIERDVLRAVLAFHSPESVEAIVASGLERHAPRTAELLRTWTTSGSRPPIREGDLRRMELADRRALGLLGLLRADPELCLAAWTPWEQEVVDDPFVTAALGQLHLTQDRAGIAYARLQAAFRAFPDVGFLCVDLADAALRSGDLVRADALLERAEELGRPAPWHGLERVRADLFARRGEQSEAGALYRWLLERQPTPRTWRNAALFFAESGDAALALELLRQHEVAYGLDPVSARHVEHLASAWWAELPARERWRALLSFLLPPRAALDLEDVLSIAKRARGMGGPTTPDSDPWSVLVERRASLRESAVLSAGRPLPLRAIALVWTLITGEARSRLASLVIGAPRNPSPAADPPPTPPPPRLPTSWSVQWQHPCTTHRDRVLFAGDRVVLRGDPARPELLFALARSDGRELWRTSLANEPKALRLVLAPEANAVLAVTLFPHLRIDAIDLSSGTSRWVWRTDGPSLGSPPQLVPAGPSGSERIAMFVQRPLGEGRPWTFTVEQVGRFLYVDPAADSALASLTAWSPPLTRLGVAAPVAWWSRTTAAPILVAHGMANGPTTAGAGIASAALLQLDAATLDPIEPERWPALSRASRSRVYRDRSEARPFVDAAAGRAYLVDSSRELLAIDLEGHRIEWRTALPTAGSNIAPVRVGDGLIVVDRDSAWAGRFDPADGDLVQEIELPAPLAQRASATAIDGGRLLLPLENGQLMAIDSSGRFEGPFVEHAGLAFAIVDDRGVLVGTRDRVFAYGP